MRLTLDVDTWWSAVVSVLLLLLLASLPIVGWILVNRIADRRPSLGQLELGPRRSGMLLARVGAVLLGLAVVLLVVGALGLWSTSSDGARHTWGWVTVVGLFGAFGAAALGALGWALSQRAAWVFLALIVFLDVEIVLISTLVDLADPNDLSLVVLLAFVTHAVCSAVTSRWSFTARLHGPVEQAKAGEAGRSIAAVWVFLTAYTLLSMITADEGIFGSTAGSAVTGALTLGALGATMGSGYTKYVEAMNAGGPRVDPATAVAARPTRPTRPTATAPQPRRTGEAAGPSG